MLAKEKTLHVAAGADRAIVTEGKDQAYTKVPGAGRDKYRIDSHKLTYHVGRVNDWLAGENIYPVYMEISPSGACNHRCTYCALDFMEYRNRHLDRVVLQDRLSELARLGLKSVMYAGEGEPFMHKELPEIIRHTKDVGIDVAITTNGVLFKPALAEKVLAATEWIKVSVSAATGPTYAKIHRTSEKDFDIVMKNIAHAVEVRQKHGYQCALGMQLLLLPENQHEAVSLAAMARDIGVDYLVIKPYSQHPDSKTGAYNNIKYGDYLHLADELAAFNSESFSVIFRIYAMRRWDEPTRQYQHCLALPFWSYIDAGGNVLGCSAHFNDSRFQYGNIYESTFEQIWQGRQRLGSLPWATNELDSSTCRVNCRMDEINKYLWELKHPPAHVNFI